MTEMSQRKCLRQMTEMSQQVHSSVHRSSRK